MSNYEDHGDVLNTSRLKDGIILKDLINGSDGFHFSVEESSMEENEMLERVDTTYDYNQYADLVNLDCLNEPDDPNNSPFDVIASQMVNVTSDGGVMKRVKRAGVGNTVPDKATVFLHYSCYLELEEVPFDSSYLRSSKPMRFQLGGDQYPGFNIALASMSQGEKSQFLIKPQYAFKSMGVPPRIPPNATIFLEVDLLRVIDCGNALNGGFNENADYEDLARFPAAFKKAKALHLLGNDHFSNKNFSAAVAIYKKASNLLSGCSLANDEEEDRHKHLLVKLYVNQAVCYNKIKMPEKVCISARDATFVDPVRAIRNTKLHFQWGKALVHLGDYMKAADHLKIALSVEPNNKDIAEELVKLEKRRKDYYHHEKISYRKALGFNNDTSHTSSNQEQPQECVEKDWLSLELEEFVKCGRSRLELPSGLTKEERRTIEKTAAKLGLVCKEIKKHNGETSIAITKL